MLTYFFYISLHYNITKNAMKKIVCILLSATLCLFSCSQREKKTKYYTSVREYELCFDDTIKDIGSINKQQQQIASCTFTMRNNGTKNININNIDYTCSCMSYILSNPIIKPGEKADITINIKTKNIYGHFNKSIIIYPNSNIPHIVRIKGYVQ